MRLACQNTKQIRFIESKMWIDTLGPGMRNLYKVGVSERTIERSVKRLKDLGELKRQGSTKSGYWEIQ